MKNTFELLKEAKEKCEQFTINWLVEEFVEFKKSNFYSQIESTFPNHIFGKLAQIQICFCNFLAKKYAKEIKHTNFGYAMFIHGILFRTDKHNNWNVENTWIKDERFFSGNQYKLLPLGFYEGKLNWSIFPAEYFSELHEIAFFNPLKKKGYDLNSLGYSNTFLYPKFHNRVWGSVLIVDSYAQTSKEPFEKLSLLNEIEITKVFFN